MDMQKKKKKKKARNKVDLLRNPIPRELTCVSEMMFTAVQQLQDQKQQQQRTSGKHCINHQLPGLCEAVVMEHRLIPCPR